MLWALIASLFAALAALLIFIFNMNKGQFDDMEEAKYTMFRDDEKEVEKCQKNEIL